MSQHEVNLGELITGAECRDAIHIAVAPVVAGEDLQPGQHVMLNADGRAVSGSQPIGVVDPYLHWPVEKDQRFWLLLNPRTITSLRHEWSHPQFTSQDHNDPWVAILSVASRLNIGTEKLMQLADGYADAGCGMWWPDNHGDATDRGYSIDWAKEFWPHWKAIRGSNAETHHEHGNPFECNC
jgi:hypothetical protein